MSDEGRLVITDGTEENTASLLVETGSLLADWMPKSPQPANPIFASSPFQDGKHLVSKTYDNIVDTFSIDIDTKAPDTTIHELRKFIILLERAVVYWTDEYNTHKYWLEIRGTCETNIRYAIVVDYNVPEIDNPYKPPLGASNTSGLEEVQLIIEHTIWTDNLTIGDECVKIFAGTLTHSAPVGVLHGELTPTCSRGPSVANYYNRMQLGYAYAHTAIGDVFGVNLADDGLANQRLLPAVPAVGDSFMACIVADAGYTVGTPFFNLIINLALAAVDVTGISAYLSDGAAGWVGPITVDYANSNPFIAAGAVLGINPMTWAPNALWAHDTYNGHLGWWIKFEVTGIGGAPAAPEKASTTQVYTTTWPNIQVMSEEIHGDISGIIDFLIKTAKSPTTSNIMISARKYSRTIGNLFSPYIALNNYELTPYTTADVGALLTFNPLAYSGWDLHWTEAGANPNHTLGGVQLDLTAYAGRYRVFIRGKVNAGAGLAYVKLRVTNQLYGYYETEYVLVDSIIDCGIISFSPETLLGTTSVYGSIFIMSYTTGAVDIDLYDMVMMPVDDANLEIITDPALSFGANAVQTKKIITSDAKYGPYGFRAANSALYLTVDWNTLTNYQLRVTVLGSFNLEPNEAYCLYFFVHDATINKPFEYLILPSLGKSQRYLLARGNE